MITMSNIEKTLSTPTWQTELQTAFTNISDLLAYLNLSTEALDQYDKAAEGFPLLVSRSYASRIQPANWQDPLLRQVLPHPDELVNQADFIKDPVGDKEANIAPGLLQKYQGRVLVITTGACAIHCRYCFRREFQYSGNSAHQSQLESIQQHLIKHPNIHEVILSGGDPLMLNDTKFSALFDFLTNLSQVKRIRLHTRLPVVLPSRITPELLTTLRASHKKVIIVIHSNHPNELSPDVANNLLSLKNTGATLLNQTVFLKGINDDPKTLIELSVRLFDCHTLPYYLHVLDKVTGSAHFDSKMHHIHHVYQQIQKELPGYLVPKLVQELAGEPNKTQLNLASLA